MELIDVIEQIPCLITNFVEQFDQTIHAHRASDAPKNPKKLFFIGSGTSYNAALSIKHLIQRHSPVEMVFQYPGEFIKELQIHSPDSEAIYIFISQGGDTRLVLTCLEAVKDGGGYTVAVSDNSEGHISQAAHVFVPMNVDGEPFIFRTAGFDMSCISLAFYCLVTLGASDTELSDLKNDLAASVESIKSTILFTQSWYEQNLPALIKAKNYIFIGEDYLVPIAIEADIKFMEMLPAFTRFFELEESIHGPQNAFTSDMVFFMIINQGTSTEKAERILAFLQEVVGATCYLVCNYETSQGVRVVAQENAFDFLQYITFFQVLAFYIAKNRGKDLKQPTYPELTDYFQKTIMRGEV